ncbi:MAG TPA: pyrroloquinoline quinone biosynthesis protein PqqB [Afifellaceae bacterium]|nr:pyrroloquinoline quinone biosynthesis protein PqqB [Afifellaceae bacterium]
MIVKVIGSAAGGGFPQWNCNAPLSKAVRDKKPGFLPRTQSSLAASSDGENWALFNASPDIREQILANCELHPSPDGRLRNTPIATIVLTNADVDHIAGLLSLRERQPLVIYATANVLKTLAENSIFNVLNSEFVERRELPLSGETSLEGPGGPIGIEIETFAVPGKIALFLEDESVAGGNFGTSEGDTIGVRITETGKPDDAAHSLFYIPGCAQVTDKLKQRLAGARVLLFDGTVFVDDEMHRTGVGEKTGARMGHLAISGPDGSIEQLSGVDIRRRIFVHINNTNPILEPGSEAETHVRNAGWEVSYDGMEIRLD